MLCGMWLILYAAEKMHKRSRTSVGEDEWFLSATDRRS